jgi:hypothetical protein
VTDVEHLLSLAQTPAGEAVTPKPREHVEVGVSYNLPFVSPFMDAWETYRDEQVSVQQMMAMRRTDGQARALYRLITLPIRAALKNATFMIAEGSDGGEKESKFIEDLLTLPESAGGMKTPFSHVIAQMLTAIFDGFSAFEMVYWVPRSGALKGKVTLEKIANRPSDTLVFLVDGKGEFAGFRQRAVFKGEVVDKRLPKETTFYYAANEEERPFYGVSYFQAAFYHWDKKVKLYYIAHLAAQRAAVGTRVGTLPPNPTKTERANFVKALSDLGVAQYIAVPQGYDVQSLKEGGNFDFLAFVNHHNSQMSKSILAQFFDKDQGGGQGDAKMVDFGQQSDAMFLLMLETIMDDIESVINNVVIPRFIDWNFKSEKYPTFRFGPLTQDEKRAIRDTFDKLAVSGTTMRASEEFLFEIEKQMAEEFGLEIDYDKIEKEREKKKVLEEKQQATMFDAQLGITPAGGPQPGQSQPPTDPSKAILPPGFALSADLGDPIVTLSELARELLLDAAAGDYGDPKVLEFAGLRRVATPEGAKFYGAPIGAQITKDLEDKAKAKHATPEPSGASSASSPGTGGHGSAADHVTGVKARYEHSGAPGIYLLEMQDGTVILQKGDGSLGAKQKFDVKTFAAKGWTPDKAFKPGGDDQKKAESKTAAEKASLSEVVDSTYDHSKVTADPELSNAVMDYVRTGYETVNSSLRGQSEANAQDEASVPLLDKATSMFKLSRPVTAYRGVDLSLDSSEDSAWAAQVQPGASFQDAAFLSTSLNQDTAKTFADSQGGLLFRMELPEGQPHFPVVSWEKHEYPTEAEGTESELLLPRDMQWEVVSRKPQSPGSKVDEVVVRPKKGDSRPSGSAPSKDGPGTGGGKVGAPGSASGGSQPPAESARESVQAEGKLDAKVLVPTFEGKVGPARAKAAAVEESKRRAAAPAGYSKPGPKTDASALHAVMLGTTPDPQLRGAISNYQGTGYLTTNRELRTGTADKNISVPKIDAAMEASSTAEDAVTYRGILMSSEDFAAWSPGAEVTDKAYVSTSTDKQIAMDFLQGSASKRVLVKVSVPKGSRAIAPSQFTGEMWAEEEVLLPRDSSFRIDKVTGGDTTTPRVEVTVLPPAGAGSTASSPVSTKSSAGVLPSAPGSSSAPAKSKSEAKFEAQQAKSIDKAQSLGKTVPAGKYHVKGNRSVGKAHLLVKPDGSGVYVNSRGEKRELSARQVQRQHVGGMNHKVD